MHNYAKNAGSRHPSVVNMMPRTVAKVAHMSSFCTSFGHPSVPAEADDPLALMEVAEVRGTRTGGGGLDRMVNSRVSGSGRFLNFGGRHVERVAVACCFRIGQFAAVGGSGVLQPGIRRRLIEQRGAVPPVQIEGFQKRRQEECVQLWHVPLMSGGEELSPLRERGAAEASVHVPSPLASAIRLKAR